MAEPGLVEEYLTHGLRLCRHIDGMVDAYYGPAGRAASVEAEPLVAPDRLVADSRSLLASIDAGSPLETASPSGGGDEEVLVAAHRRLEEVLPGSDPLAERLVAWRESHAVPVEKLRPAIDSLAEDLRHRTKTLFGLPDGEHVEFELVTAQPWSGFNYYLGDLHSRVAVNTDLPVLSTSLAHLVAHESYPGHHTEHTRKEVGLVRRRHWWEESIFLVGTPQCLLAEGLADRVSRWPWAVVPSRSWPSTSVR